MTPNILDLRQERCPMALLLAKRHSVKLEVGQSLIIYVSDNSSMKDIVTFLSKCFMTSSLRFALINAIISSSLKRNCSQMLKWSIVGINDVSLIPTLSVWLPSFPFRFITICGISLAYLIAPLLKAIVLATCLSGPLPISKGLRSKNPFGDVGDLNVL